MRRKAREERLEVLHRLIAAYRQYHQALGAYFLPQTVPSWKAERLLRQKTGVWDIFSGWGQGLRRSRHILSVAEVLALWHLPQALDIADIPLVVHGRARTLLAPIELTHANGWHLGTSSHAGYTVPVCIPPHGLRGNVLAVASTGKGKSTLFQHLAQARLLLRQYQKQQVHLIEQANGLLVIEPHGDMIATLCSLVPPELHDETVVIDLADQEHPPGINPLDMTLGRSRDKAVDTLLSIFKHIWDNSWGPRTENILEFSLKTLADANAFLIQQNPQYGPDQQYTLLDVISLLRNAGFRHSVFEQVTDTALLLWWRHYYEAMDSRFQTEVISSVVNKMSKYGSSYIARRLLGQPRSSLNMKELIAEGKILLISTASGVVGADVSALLGATLLGLFQNTLAEQAILNVGNRQKYFMLIDEFQTYPGTNYNTMLAELRKYGGNFGLATQSLAYLDVLDKALRPTVLSNIDHLYAFDMSGEDARMLLSKLEGITIEDITNLDDYMCYVKASFEGRRLPVFSMRLNEIGQGDVQFTRHLRTLSQQRYARPVAAVDAQLVQIAIKRTLAEDAHVFKRNEVAVKTEVHDEQVVQQEKTYRTSSDKKSKGAPRKRGGTTRKEPPLTTPDGATYLSQPIITNMAEADHSTEGIITQQDREEEQRHEE